MLPLDILLESIMRTTIRLSIVAAICVAATASPALRAAPADRLPALVQSNIFLTGQALGCVIRFEIYTSESRAAFVAAGAAFPSQANDVNVLFGLDVSGLKADLVEHMGSQATALDVPTLVGSIEDVSRTELAGTDLADGFMFPWMQVAGCTTLFRQLGLFDSYLVHGAAT